MKEASSFFVPLCQLCSFPNQSPPSQQQQQKDKNILYVKSTQQPQQQPTVMNVQAK